MNLRAVRRLRGGTLRTRLTLLLVVVLLGSTVVIGVVTTLSLRTFLLNRLDDQLTQAGGRFSASLEHGQLAPGGSDGDADNAVPGQSVGTLGVRLVRGAVTQAAVVDGDGENSTPTLTAADATALADLPVDGSSRSVELDRLGDYRLQAVAGHDGDVQVTGLRQHEVDETLARLVTVEAVLFGVVILVAAGIVTVLVRRTLRPLEQVTEAARQVADLPLTDADTVLPSGLAPRTSTSEVDRVSTAFEHMLDHVRAALLARDATEARLRQFVADASHELRTPLAVIRSHSEFALRDDGTALTASQHEALARIDDATVRMASLVEDLLLLARLDDGHALRAEPTDLSRIVVEAVVDARPLAPDHRWNLTLPEESFEVVGDRLRLRQVVVNLVGNARLHTPAGTTVTVSLDLDASGDHAVIVVADDGPGIPSALQATVFDRFTRGDTARSGGHGSTGLGLAITHDVVVAHGGSVEVSSRPGDTRFVVRLPTGAPTTTDGAEGGADPRVREVVVSRYGRARQG